MAYVFKIFDTLQQPVQLEALTGRRPMLAYPVRTVFKAEDAIPTQARRILLQVGLHGTEEWMVRDDATSIMSQTRPTRALKRYVARSPILRLTPGAYLRMWAVVLPAGMTVKLDVSDWVDDGCFGKVGVEVTYRVGGDTSVKEASFLTSPSLAPNGAQPQQDSGAFGSGLQQMHTELLIPPAIVDNAASLDNWSDGVTAEIAVYYQGSPRVVDLVVFEEPYRFAADTADALWPLPMLTGADGKIATDLPSDYPVRQSKSGQTGGGTYAQADAALRQREIGPLLWCHTTHVESAAGYTDAEPDPATVTSTSYVEVLSGASSYNTDRPGVSVSCGANARVQKSTHHTLVLRDKDNVVPVRCWIRAKNSAGGEIGTIRFMSADYSIAEVVVTGTSYAWFSATGHLRCGLGPEDTTLLQVLAMVTGGTLSWTAIAVEYAHIA